jgi:hypothetical protein
LLLRVDGLLLTLLEGGLRCLLRRLLIRTGAGFSGARGVCLLLRGNLLDQHCLLRGFLLCA